ncbi:hypothetical protein [Jeotgalibaca sp. PTS2502]
MSFCSISSHSFCDKSSKNNRKSNLCYKI